MDQVEEGRQPVEAAVLAGQGGGEVEAEPVHAHLAEPVAQRVHDELEAGWVAGVEGVAAAGGIDMAAGVGRVQAVVGGVVQATVAQGRPEVVTLGGVVEHHVQQDLQSRGVQRGDHGLELGHLTAGAAGPDGGRVAGMRGEEADGVVAPVVGEPPLDQERLGQVLVHRQQLDRGHPEVDQVGQRGLVAQPRVGAAQLLRHAGMAHSGILDVHLVDDGVGVAVVGAGADQSKAGSTTRLRGTWAAESSGLARSGSATS